MHNTVEQNSNHPDGGGLLLSRDERVDVNFKNSNGETPITVALMKGKTEMVKILLENPRVDLDTLDCEGRFLENIAR